MSIPVPQRATYEYDLSATLFLSRWAHRQPLDDKVLLYVPDWPGMPIVAGGAVRDLCDEFAGGAIVGEVLRRYHGRDGRTFTEWLEIVGELADRGLLRDQADSETFDPRPISSARKSMNVWLHINNNCNLACSYCFVEHTKQSMTDETIDATVASIGATVRRHGVDDVLFKFAGGEPTLMLPQMERFFERATAELQDTGAYVHWAVLTNGTVVNDRLIEFIDRAHLSVSISIDGYGPDHDLYRVFRNNGNGSRRGSWSTVLRSIEILEKHGTVPYINAMAGPKTSRGLPDLAAWIFGGGMMGTVHVVRNLDDSWEGGEARKREYADYCAQLARDFEAMFEVLEREEYRLRLPRWVEIAELSFDRPAASVCCGIARDHFVIAQDGRLASCPMTVNERTVPASDDLFEAVTHTFEGRPDVRASDECLRCQWFRVCASACPVTNERVVGHPFIQSPLCDFWKYVIPRYLLFHGRKLRQAGEDTAGPIWSGFAAR
jgi:uncharacterized protein